MQLIRTLAIVSAVAFLAAGCSGTKADSIKGSDHAEAGICIDPHENPNGILTGLNFVVMGDNSADLTIGDVTLIEPQNIDLLESFIVRDGSFDTATMAPEDMANGEHEFEAAAGAALAPDEVDFSVAVQVVAKDPAKVATFSGVRVTYVDEAGSSRSEDSALDFSFSPGCG
jgi:hypothetical protein